MDCTFNVLEKGLSSSWLLGIFLHGILSVLVASCTNTWMLLLSRKKEERECQANNTIHHYMYMTSFFSAITTTALLQKTRTVIQIIKGYPCPALHVLIVFLIIVPTSIILFHAHVQVVYCKNNVKCHRY